MGSAMWMIELATKTITADSRIGSHKAVMGTIVPPLELALSTDAFHQKPQRVCPKADLSQALDRWIRRDVCSNWRRNLVSSLRYFRGSFCTMRKSLLQCSHVAV